MPRPTVPWIGACVLALAALLPACGAEPVTVRTVGTVPPTAPPTTTTTTTTTTSSTTTTVMPATTAATARVCCAYSVERAARQRVPTTRAPAPPPASPAAPSGAGASMPSLLRRIGGCESSGRPDGPLRWQADNPTSSASGAFQILDSTWRGWARSYGADVGAGQYARARHAPADVQTTVARRAFDAQGTRPWAASRSCWA